MEQNRNKLAWVGITEIVSTYLPMSKRKARKFVAMYLEPKRIGNRIFVDRGALEALLKNPDRGDFPLL